ncbi:PAS domain S-box protein [Rhodoferax sp.]|uniref:PAS domain S-box protein n=1 Tax=Rhodoferax sp. TaxID=50421 RepID=UPI002602C98C|nr:PAS domain S-box protein [Rhodoferax sp.]MDD2925193.1 PAS domain S-box protein [Rhodoferax sp.]
MTLQSLARFLFGSLRGRLIVGVVVLNTVLMALLVSDLTWRQRGMLLERQIEEANALSLSLATSAAGWIAADDVSGLQELVDAQARYPEVLFAILVDRDGRVMAATDPTRLGLYLQDLPKDIRRTVLSETSSLVDVVAPAVIGGLHVGWARVGVGQKTAGEKLANITRSGMVYALVAISLGALFAWVMGRVVTRRLYAVLQTFDEIRSGNRLARSTLTGTDEIVVIAREFNTMLDAMAQRDVALHVSEERYRELIQKVQTAIILHDGQGRVLDSNLLAQELLGLSGDQLLGRALMDSDWHFLRPDGTVLPIEEYPVSQILAAPRALKNLVLGIRCPGRSQVTWVLLSAEPECDKTGALVQVIVSFVDITAHKQADEALRQLNRKLRAISNCNQTLMRAVDEDSLLSAICRIVCDEAGYRMAWVGYAENDDGQSIRPVAWAGDDDGQIKQFRLTWADTEAGSGPAGRAIRSGQSQSIQDMAAAAAGFWRDQALQRGYRSIIALPLKDDQASTFGVLNIYSAEPHAFTGDEVALLQELAGDLAFGIVNLRTRAERQRLELQKEQYLKFFMLSSEAMCIVNPVGFFTQVNPAFSQLTGRSESELLSRPLLEFIHPEDIQQAQESIDLLLSQHPSLHVDIRYKRKDDTYVLLSWVAFLDQKEGVIYAAARDITESRRAELALRESEETLRTITGSARDAVLMLDNDGRIALWNTAAQDIFGYTTEEAMGQDLHALLAPQRFRAVAGVAFEHFRLTGEGAAVGKTAELVAQRKSGEEFPVELSLSAVKLRGKWQAIGIARDITERKKAEQEMARLSSRNELILNSVGEGILGVDIGGACTFVNPAALRLLGFDAAELVGENIHRMFHHTRLDGSLYREADCPIHAACMKGESASGDDLYWRKDGSSFSVGFVTSPITEAGQITGAVVTFRDITERKLAQEQLQRSEQGLAQAQRMAHLGNWQLDLVNQVLTWSDEIYRIFEIKQDQFGASYRAFLEAIHPQDRTAVDQAYTDSIKHRRPYEITHRLLMKDGRVKYVHEQCETFYDPAGKPLRSIGTVQDITESKLAELALENTNRALRTLSACNMALVQANSEAALLDSICRLIVEKGGYRMAWVGFAQHDPQKTVRPVAQFGHEEGFLEEVAFSWADNELGRGPTGTAIRTGEVQVNQDFLSQPALSPWREAALRRGYQSSIALPLRSTAATLGVLTIDAQDPNAFNDTEIALLQELASDLAFGIESLRTRAERDSIVYEHLHHEEILRQSLEQSIGAIADTVEARDPYTAGHQHRVSELSEAIARDMGLPDERIQGIRLAASIHDLGKIQVPAEILSKPGKLTDIELMFIRTHPQAGYDILKEIQFPWPIADMVHQHHERLDGSGYPQGLKGDQILLDARILTVADVVEAMASHRPYRASLGIDSALHEIELGRGRLYDPTVVDVCLRLFREGRFAFQL